MCFSKPYFYDLFNLGHFYRLLALHALILVFPLKAMMSVFMVIWHVSINCCSNYFWSYGALCDYWSQSDCNGAFYSQLQLIFKQCYARVRPGHTVHKYIFLLLPPSGGFSRGSNEVRAFDLICSGNHSLWHLSHYHSPRVELNPSHSGSGHQEINS